MQNDINNLDPEDIGLKQVMGARFHDETTEAPQKPKEIRKPSNTTQPEKAAQNPARKPTTEAEAFDDATWQPVKPDPNWLDNLKACVKWLVLFGGLCALFFYWQQTGQMADSAAVPSMCVCCALAGLSVGKNAAWGDNRW